MAREVAILYNASKKRNLPFSPTQLVAQSHGGYGPFPPVASYFSFHVRNHFFGLFIELIDLRAFNPIKELRCDADVFILNVW